MSRHASRGSSAVLVRFGSGAAAIALLLVAARLPIWQALFSAPQYPQGLDIVAYGDRVEGDLGEINELSHYIGMPPFNFVGMPEMRLWPWVILVGVAAAVLAVVTRRRWLGRLACAAVGSSRSEPWPTFSTASGRWATASTHCRRSA